MEPREAIQLLVAKFPILAERSGESDYLTDSPHVMYNLLATEIHDNRGDLSLLNRVAEFIEDLANSNDDLLQELLVIDLLEGIAQDENLSRQLGAKLSSRSAALLSRVEKEYFGRNKNLSSN